jgi:hypothetical protein
LTYLTYVLKNVRNRAVTLPTPDDFTTPAAVLAYELPRFYEQATENSVGLTVVDLTARNVCGAEITGDYAQIRDHA